MVVDAIGLLHLDFDNVVWGRVVAVGVGPSSSWRKRMVP